MIDLKRYGFLKEGEYDALITNNYESEEEAVKAANSVYPPGTKIVISCLYQVELKDIIVLDDMLEGMEIRATENYCIEDFEFHGLSAEKVVDLEKTILEWFSKNGIFSDYKYYRGGPVIELKGNE